MKNCNKLIIIIFIYLYEVQDSILTAIHVTFTG